MALTRMALKRYFAAYEKFIDRVAAHTAGGPRTSLRKCIRRQAEILSAVIQNDDEYIPFEVNL